MGFLNSWPLWGGLAAAGIAVPIIIHLLYRKHRRQTDWAAMEFLREAMLIRSRRIRLEDVLLMILRCLVLLLIALTFLRLTLDSSAGGERTRKKGVVIAIDGSYSMGHKVATVSRLDKAKKRALDILATVLPGSKVSLVLLGKRPRIIRNRTSYDVEGFEQALKEQAFHRRCYRLLTARSRACWCEPRE